MSSTPTPSLNIRNFPYDQLKNLYENPGDFSSFPTALRSMIWGFLPKNREWRPNQNLLDPTDEAIRSIAFSVIEKLGEREQTAILLMATRVDFKRRGFQIVSTRLRTDQRMAVAKELSLSLLLEAMQEFSSQKEVLEGWEKGDESRIEANERIFVSLTKLFYDSFYCHLYNTLDLSVLSLTLPPPFISELAFGRIKEVSLAGNNLEKIPSLRVLKSLKKLDLSHNKISTIRIGANSLESLEELLLNSNQILEIPKDLTALPCLEVLDLGNNKISTIRQRVLFPLSLRDLNLSKNQIITIPRKLEGFSDLKSLDLSENRISVIPERLKDLRSLRILNVAYNEIVAVPRRIEGLYNLEDLVIDGNKVGTLPETWGVQTFMLTESLKPLYTEVS